MIKLVAVSGPSGSGKTTLVHQLLQNHDRFSFSISATTRPQRPNEQHGKDYYFFSPEEFKKKIKKGEFIEYQEVYPGILYGTLKSEIERIHAIGKIAVLDIDVLGALNIKKIYGEKALLIFIHPGSIENLKNRLIHRETESEQSLEKRLHRATKEMEMAFQFDYIIKNDSSLESAYQQFEKLILSKT